MKGHCLYTKLSAILISAICGSVTSQPNYLAPEELPNISGLSHYAPDPCGFLLAQTTTEICYAVDENGNQAKIPESGVNSIDPTIIDFIFPTEPGTWRTTSTNELTYESWGYSYQTSFSSSYLSGMRLHPHVYLCTGHGEDYIYEQYGLPKMGEWVKVAEFNYYQSLLCLTNNMECLFIGGDSSWYSKSAKNSSSTYVDTSRDDPVSSSSSGYQYVTGWDQDNQQFLRLTKQGEEIISRYNESDTLLTLPGSFTSSELLLCRKANNRHALALHEGTALSLWYENVDQSHSMYAEVSDFTSATLWINEMGNLYYFNEKGFLAFLKHLSLTR